jgi:nitronate monooxygenase
MKVKRLLCEKLEIRVPIIQAPIGSAVSPHLVAAVSNAGGLGFHAFSWKTKDEIKDYIAETRRLTSHRFGVNLVLAWSQYDRLKICLNEGIQIFSFSWGESASYIKIVHEFNGIAFVTVGSADDAKRAVDAGADIIVAQSWEAGGHILGQVGGLALIPKVVDAVSPVPVVAAGGIADGRGFVAALALGASGIWLGTRFLASREALAHAVYQEKILTSKETDTVYSLLFDGGWKDAPHRVIHNSTVERWEKENSPESGQRPNEGEVIGTSPMGAN